MNEWSLKQCANLHSATDTAAQAHAHRLWPAAVRSPNLLTFNGLHTHNPLNYYFFADSGGKEG